jgi:hypothetical protein
MDDEKTTEQAAEELQAEVVREHDERLVNELARAMDPDAWLPENLPDWNPEGGVLLWASRRMIARRHAQRALPWVKSQALAAYQEGFAAADQVEGAL